MWKLHALDIGCIVFEDGSVSVTFEKGGFGIARTRYYFSFLEMCLSLFVSGARCGIVLLRLVTPGSSLVRPDVMLNCKVRC